MEENIRISREAMIGNVISSRYSIDDQISLLRQKDAKPEEYQAFYEFAEDVKKKVTAEYEEYEEADAMAEDAEGDA